MSPKQVLLFFLLVITLICCINASGDNNPSGGRDSGQNGAPGLQQPGDYVAGSAASQKYGPPEADFTPFSLSVEACDSCSFNSNGEGPCGANPETLSNHANECTLRTGTHVLGTFHAYSIITASFDKHNNYVFALFNSSKCEPRYMFAKSDLCQIQSCCHMPVTIGKRKFNAVVVVEKKKTTGDNTGKGDNGNTGEVLTTADKWILGVCVGGVVATIIGAITFYFKRIRPNYIKLRQLEENEESLDLDDSITDLEL